TTVMTSGQASGTTPTPVGSAAIPTGIGKLSGISVRYQVRNNFDPRSSAFKESWRKSVENSEELKSAAIAVQTAWEDVMKTLTAEATPLDRNMALQMAKGDQSGRALADFFEMYFLTQRRDDPQLTSAIMAVMPLRSVYRDAWFKALDGAVGVMLT